MKGTRVIMKVENDDIIKNQWKDIEDESMHEILVSLKRYDYNTQTMLANYVASLCDISVVDMLSQSDKSHIAQSRWLFWYAYRYMTNETYERIAQRCIMDGCEFSSESIRVGCAKMSSLVETDFMWKRRWRVLKHIIKLWNEVLDESNEYKKKKITLNISDDIEVEIKKR